MLALKISLGAGICFLSGFLISSQTPKIRSFILVKIEQASRDHLPVRILPGKVDVHFFPLGAKFERVEILPKEDFKKILDSASFEMINVSISPWQLINGRLRLTSLEIEGARVSAVVPPSKKKAGSPLEGLFNLINQVPVNEVEIRNTSVQLQLKDPRMDLSIDDVTLAVEKRRGGIIALDIDSGSVQIRTDEVKSALRVELEGAAIASPESFELADFKVRRGDSYLTASGSLKGNVEKLDFKEINVEAKSELHLDSMRNWATKTFKDLAKIPALKGRAYAEAKVVRSANKPLAMDLKARTEALQIEKFLLDRIETAGTLTEKEMKFPKVVLDHPSGQGTLTDTQIKLAEKEGDETSMTTKLNIANVQLHELLKALGIGAIPVHLQVSGETPCRGTFTPQFFIRCQGQAQGANLLIRDSMASRSTIVALREFNANGEFTIDKEKVAYATELAMPNSRGRSSGTIGYETGFKIAYEGDRVELRDVANLADLKLEGAAKIKGMTEGTSDWATIDLDIEGTDMWLEDFWLGNAKSKMSYKAGQLGFNAINGYYSVSRYNGDVKLDLPKKEISIAGRVPFYDARDLMKVFSRLVKLPFAVHGTGQATVKASGPLALNLLSYDLKSSLFRGSVAGETFDQANFDVKSIGGEVKAERVQVLKGTSVMNLTGTGHPDGTIKTAIQGRGFKLEDSVIVASTGLNLSGLVDFDMDLNGPVLAPDANLKGRLTKTSVGDQAVADSDFQLKFAKRTLEGNGVFLGDVVRASFVIPYEPNAPFSLKATSQEWNFAPLFAAIAGPGSRKDYEGRLTSTIDLSAPTGGFWNATGTVRFDKFSLARGSMSIKNTEPVSLRMRNGQVKVDKFDLAGENLFLRVTEKEKPTSKLDLQVNGKLDLSIAALVAPFFEDLRGLVSFAFNWRGGPETNELLGSAYVDKGYLKFFEFPHPIEDIQIDLLFNQRKILFNTVKAEFGGGRVSGSGAMELKGSKNTPVNVSGTFEKVTLNVPEKVRTTGSGNLAFTGNWFPFTLKIDYDVKEGLVTKEFGGDATDAASVRRDQFLPELLLQERFVPINLDLAVNFQKGVQVKNELVDGRVTGELTVKGNPAKPSMLGNIAMDRETKIYFKDTPFEVDTASIQLTDPTDVNPRLFISARSRVQDYDVTLLVQGQASPKPDISLTSVPPLPEKDIISLLALGATDTALTSKVGSSEQGTQTGLQIGSTALKNNPISKEIKDRFGFDVQFAPGFDEATAVQKIIVSRQFMQKVNVSASQSLGKSRGTEAELRYKFNDKFSSVFSWQSRGDTEINDATKKLNKDPNTFGLDLEYKFEFK